MTLSASRLLFSTLLFRYEQSTHSCEDNLRKSDCLNTPIANPSFLARQYNQGRHDRIRPRGCAAGLVADELHQPTLWPSRRQKHPQIISHTIRLAISSAARKTHPDVCDRFSIEQRLLKNE